MEESEIVLLMSLSNETCLEDVSSSTWGFLIGDNIGRNVTLSNTGPKIVCTDL